MDPFEADTDMITIADEPINGAGLSSPASPSSPSQIYTRAKRYEPQRMLIGSGRASIRDSIRDMMNAVRDKAAEYGIRRVVESLNEEQTQALWKADDVAWFWLATGESNARPLGQHDIIRMHTATLRRMLDNGSFESAKEQMDLTEIGSFDNLDCYSDWKFVLACTDFTQAESDEFQRLCKANWRLPNDYDLLDPTHRPAFPPRPDPDSPQASPDCVFQPPQATPDCTIPPKSRGKHRRGRGKGKKSTVPHLVIPTTTFLAPAAVPPLQVLVPVPYLGTPTTSSVISNP